MQFINQYLPSIVLLICAIYTGVAEKYNSQKKGKSILLIIVLSLAALFTFYESKSNSDQNRRIEANTILANKLVKANNEMTMNIADLSQQIKEISLENRKLTDQNIQLSKYTKEINKQVLSISSDINGFLKGSNSFCYLQLMSSFDPSVDRSSVYDFIVRGKGKNLLKNVKVRMVDSNTYPWNYKAKEGEVIKVYTKSEIDSWYTYMQLGDINPNEEFYLADRNIKKRLDDFFILSSTPYKYVPNKQTGVKLTLQFTTDIDLWHEELRMAYLEGKWVTIISVVRQGKLLYKTPIPKNFPKELLKGFTSGIFK